MSCWERGQNILHRNLGKAAAKTGWCDPRYGKCQYSLHASCACFCTCNCGDSNCHRVAYYDTFTCWNHVLQSTTLILPRCCSKNVSRMSRLLDLKLSDFSQLLHFPNNPKSSCHDCRLSRKWMSNKSIQDDEELWEEPMWKKNASTTQGAKKQEPAGT